MGGMQEIYINIISSAACVSLLSWTDEAGISDATEQVRSRARWFLRLDFAALQTHGVTWVI
jgi:hypothetical protein